MSAWSSSSAGYTPRRTQHVLFDMHASNRSRNVNESRVEENTIRRKLEEFVEFAAVARSNRTRNKEAQMEQQSHSQGVVRWFSAQKGYGFIQSQSGEDVFVHFTAIKSEGYKSLEDGQDVLFDVERTPKGLQAASVVVR
jgi:CspA family cold shock protein